jgi:hypothetical protein
MKKIILTIAMLITITTSGFSQDDYPKPFKFDYKVNGVQKTNEPFKREYIKQTKFHLGTQWYGHPIILKALKMDVNEGTQSGDDIIPNTDSNYKMRYIFESKSFDNDRVFQYEPTLYIPLSDTGKLITKPNDKNHSIWGFSNIQGTRLLPADTSNENYDRLILYHDSSYINSVVLENSWLRNKYEYFSFLLASSI